MNGAALMVVDRVSRRRASSVTVAIGHSSTLVAAGLAATLTRIPGCRVRLWQGAPAGGDHEAQLIFGDSVLLRRLREQVKSSLPRPLPNAKFVLVTTGDDRTADASKAAGEIDDCLSIECREEDLVATVRRLIDDDGAPALTLVASRNSGGVASQSNLSTHRRVEENADPALSRTNAGAPRSPSRPRVTGGLAAGALRRVREYIEQHLTGKVRTGDLAKLAGLSPGHFNRAFRQSTGQSPHRYVTLRRVSIATELLAKTSRALADIALDAGFADQSHFSRTYAAVTGETPSACRRRHQ